MKVKKLSRPQNTAMQQIWELGNGVYGEKNVRPSASDMMNIPMKTLNSLAMVGLIEGRHLHNADKFPRIGIVWSLTDNGKLYCDEKFDVD